MDEDQEEYISGPTFCVVRIFHGKHSFLDTLKPTSSPSVFCFSRDDLPTLYFGGHARRGYNCIATFGRAGSLIMEHA
jgi:hypothetical protein